MARRFHSRARPARAPPRSSPSRAPSTAARMATISAGGQEKHLEGFRPVLPGFDSVPLGDIAQVEAAIGEQTAAILIEPIQGEGGIRSRRVAVPRGAAAAVRRARPPADLRRGADRHGADRPAVRLRVDRDHARHHVARQGPGRRLSDRRVPRRPRAPPPAWRPALTARPSAATRSPAPSPTACWTCCSRTAFSSTCAQVAGRLHAELDQLAAAFPAVVQEIRGQGLLLGLRCGPPNTDIAPSCMARGMLTVPAGDNVLRLLPPLIIEPRSRSTRPSGRFRRSSRTSPGRRRHNERAGPAFPRHRRAGCGHAARASWTRRAR